MRSNGQGPGGGGRTAGNGWTYALEEALLPEGGLVPCYPLGINIVLARVGGSVYALEGRCAHMGCPLFCGTLSGFILMCPCHDWRFDVRTGGFLDAPEIRLKAYPVRAGDGKLFVELSGGEPR